MINHEAVLWMMPHISLHISDDIQARMINRAVEPHLQTLLP